MKALGLSYFTDTYLTAIGLLIFVLFFIATIGWVMHPYNRSLYKRIENLPLENENEPRK